MYFWKTRNLPNTRIDVADALRGIAVAGIILYHAVEHFDVFTKKTILYSLPIDQMVGKTIHKVVRKETQKPEKSIG